MQRPSLMAVDGRVNARLGSAGSSAAARCPQPGGLRRTARPGALPIHRRPTTPTLAPAARIGLPVEVTLAGNLKQRGVVRFVGPTDFSSAGTWIGVELDDAVGRNDGSVDGREPHHHDC